MQSDDSFVVNSIYGTFPLNAMFEQNIINLIKSSVVFCAKFSDTDTRQVIFDKVINIKRKRFNGHVYNLQTESGIYVANNIITHNCRSMLLSVTIYEYPDGLLTSTEFDEIPASNQRQADIDEVRKIIEAEVKPTVIPTIPVKENLVFAAAVSSIEDLRKMFSNNEIPIKIEGSRSEQAQIFEEINRLYPAPSNIMSEYHVDEVSGMASIYFDNNVVRGEDTLIRFPSGRKATENEKSGAIKYAIYKHRPRLELAALCRRGGFATFDMAEKYGGRFLTDIEKAAVNSEMNAYILKLFGTPLSEEGQKANESHWVKEPGGWKRSGDVF